MLNKNSIQPLYKQLMDIIASQIKKGTYKPGEKIPTEPEK
jgi:DNA-binding GntR family transcriptional regulator